MVVVADLVARVRSEGVQQAAQDVKAVGVAAEQTARAYEIMAAAMAKANPGQGSASDFFKILQQANVQPTAAALAEAAKQAQATSAAVAASVPHTQNAAKAAKDMADAHGLSESTLIKSGAALVGIGLGLSAVVGVATQLHEVIVGVVNAQLDWERSLKNLSGLYGDAGANAAALATAQANLPGVLGTQQEFARAAVNASGLTLRYGLSQQSVNQLTTTGGRVAFATGMTDPAARAQLQAQILAATETGASLPAEYGVYTDPEAVARRLGFQGQQSLQAFTPQELMQARQAILSEGLNVFSDRAEANRRAALETATKASQAADQARTNLQNMVEDAGTQPNRGSTIMPVTQFDVPFIRPIPGSAYARVEAQQAAKTAGQAPGFDYEGAAREVNAAAVVEAQALANSAKAQEDARKSIESLAHSADSAGASLLSFFGSLEDTTSIAHGDLLAQAQGAVAARAQSAIPLIGQTQGERTALSINTAYQQAYQNYVAQLAQEAQPNAIQRNLEQLANQQGPGLETQRAAAQRALQQAPQLQQIDSRMAEAQKAGALVDMATAQTQADLQKISLTQQERQVQLLRDTVDLRKLDVQQQQALVLASQGVIRAQQAGLGAQYALSDAQYTTTRASVLAQARMARVLQGKDVSGLPSIDELIQMNVQGQFATAEAGPAALTAGRAVELAQRTATSAGLAQQLTGGTLQYAELGNDLKNLGDLPSQTALMLQDIQNGRDSLAVQKELRDLTKDLVRIMTGRPASNTSDQGVQDLSARLGVLLFGDDGGGSSNLAPPDLPANRRGPS